MNKKHSKEYQRKDLMLHKDVVDKFHRIAKKRKVSVKKSMEDAGKSLKDYKPHQLSALIGLAFFRYDVELNKMELYLDEEFHEVSGVQEFAALCDIFNKKGNLPDFFN